MKYITYSVLKDLLPQLEALTGGEYFIGQSVKGVTLRKRGIPGEALDVLGTGRISKSILYAMMKAYIKGINEGKSLNNSTTLIHDDC